MKILVINCGSSSIKYQLIDMDGRRVLAKGLLERIGIEGSRLVHKVNGQKHIFEKEIKDHEAGSAFIIEKLTDAEAGVIKDVEEIKAVGHRVVHAGEKYASSVLITDDVMDALEECISLAPLHNPANIAGIKAIKKILPSVPHIGVFDTAFHQTMETHAYLYAIPYEYYDKYKVRRYGFHGTSHKYVSRRAAEIIGKTKEELKIITCHLGNGASIAAVKHGKSVDTSMGFTPLEGLCMGTRSGDIDPAIIPFLQREDNKSCDEIDKILNKKSGVLGLTGISSDMRDIEEAAEKGDKKAKAALNLYHYRIAKYIGAYTAAMNGVDIIVFTAGVGENGPETREDVCSYLGFLGVTVDKEKNKSRGEEVIITTSDSKVKVIVVPTNEELEIASDTQNIVEKM